MGESTPCAIKHSNQRWNDISIRTTMCKRHVSINILVHHVYVSQNIGCIDLSITYVAVFGKNIVF